MQSLWTRTWRSWLQPLIVINLAGLAALVPLLASGRLPAGADALFHLYRTVEMSWLLQHGVWWPRFAPDLLFGFDADPAIRNVIGVALKHTDLAVQGVMMRKYGQEIIKATAGKKIHGTGAIPGGVNKNLSIAERDVFLKDVDQMVTWARGALKIAKDYTVQNLQKLAPFGSFDSNHMALVRQVKERVAGQLLADGAQNGKATNARIKDAAAALIISHLERYLLFSLCSDSRI